jgi:hypothetical protein
MADRGAVGSYPATVGEATAIGDALEQREERSPIAVVSGHGCARVAARPHVVDAAGHLETERASHANKQSATRA